MSLGILYHSVSFMVLCLWRMVRCFTTFQVGSDGNSQRQFLMRTVLKYYRLVRVKACGCSKKCDTVKSVRATTNSVFFFTSRNEDFSVFAEKSGVSQL